MSEYAKVSDAVLAFLDKYNSGEFSKIDCSVTLHKRDDQIQKLEAELAEANQAVHGFERINKELHNELAESRKTIAELVKNLESLAKRHGFQPGFGDCICQAHLDAWDLIDKHKLKEK